MDAMNIEVSMLSISMPHVHFGDDAAARKLARELNEAGAKLVNDYPNRFGHFAVVPLPDVDGTLMEIEYALDVLKADGIKLPSNSRGVYPGEVRLEGDRMFWVRKPVWQVYLCRRRPLPRFSLRRSAVGDTERLGPEDWEC